jgi:transposase InsO family protein/dUTPase
MQKPQNQGNFQKKMKTMHPSPAQYGNHPQQYSNAPREYRNEPQQFQKGEYYSCRMSKMNITDNDKQAPTITDKATMVNTEEISVNPVSFGSENEIEVNSVLSFNNFKVEEVFSIITKEAELPRVHQNFSNTFLVNLKKNVMLHPGASIRVATGLAIHVPKGLKAKITPDHTPNRKGFSVGCSFIPSGGGTEPLVIKITNYSDKILEHESSYCSPVVSVVFTPETSEVYQSDELHFAPSSEMATVMMKLNGKKLPVILDSAAMRNCISAEAYKRFFKNKILARPDTQLVSAERKSMKVLGTIMLDLDLENNDKKGSLAQEFHVVQSLGRPVLLSYRTLKELGTILNTSRDKVTFQLKEKIFTYRTILEDSSTCPSQFSLHLAESYSLPAMSEVVVLTTIPKCLKESRLPRSVWIEPSTSCIRKHGIYCAKIMTPLEDVGQIKTILANTTEVSVVLEKGTVVAAAKTFLNKEYHEVHGVFDELSVTAVPNETESSDIGDKDYPDDLQISKSLTHVEKRGLRKLLRQFKDLWANDNEAPTHVNPELAAHEIILQEGTRPLRENPRRESPERRLAIKEYIEKMEKEGLIKKSNSPWASPVLLVSKKDGSWRFCVDYRRLNNVTVKDTYPLPRIDDTIDALAGVQYMSTFDLASGYYQISMDKDSMPMTAFTTHHGLYEYMRMPFGLTNAPATFQRVMDSALAGLKWQTCLVYLDDIIVFSKTFDSHLKDLELVFLRLRSHGLKLKAKKCHLCCNEVLYLGHLITRDGVREDPAKVDTVKNFPQPKQGDRKALESFLGMTGYFQRFIKDYALIVQPLRDLLKEDKWNWTQTCTDAFEELKFLLVHEGGPVLALPNFSGKYPFSVHTDASDFGICAVLYQRQPNGTEKVIRYASRTLTDGERKWQTTEKEALAIIWACEQFAPYLLGGKFDVITDHSSLQWLLSAKKGRLARWALRAAEFDYNIKHCPGKENKVPDHGSRYPTREAVPLSEEYEGRLDDSQIHLIASDGVNFTIGCEEKEISTIDQVEDCGLASDLVTMSWDIETLSKEYKDAYKSDIYVTKLLEIMSQDPSNSRVRFFEMNPNGILVRNIEIPSGPDKSLQKFTQLVIPKALQRKTLHLFHDSRLGGHLGRNKTYTKMLDHVYWPGMYRDLKKYIATCDSCQRHKAVTQGKNRELFASMPQQIWETAHIDLVGPFPPSEKGNQYICVITDSFSKWAEAVPIPNKSEAVVAEAIFNALICKHSIPLSIRTDQGREFCNALMKHLTTMLKMKHIVGSPYYPQANGQVERFNRTLVESLRKLCFEEEYARWDQYIEGVLFSYRTSFHQEIQCSPFELMYGRKPVLPTDILAKELASFDSTDPDTQKSRLLYNLNKMHKTVRALLKDSAQRKMNDWNKGAKTLVLEPGNFVLLRDTVAGGTKNMDRDILLNSDGRQNHKLSSEWLGPYKVIEVKRNAIVIADTHRKIERTVSLAHLKLYKARETEKEATVPVTDDGIPKSSAPKTSKRLLLEKDTLKSLPHGTRSSKRLRTPNTRLRDYDLATSVPSEEKLECSSKVDDPNKLYMIASIVDHLRKGNRFEYLVTWENCPQDMTSWVPFRDFQQHDCIREYWLRTIDENQGRVPKDFHYSRFKDLLVST